MSRNRYEKEANFTERTREDFGVFLLQIKHMMAFIEQEANEKAEEIDAKARRKNAWGIREEWV